MYNQFSDFLRDKNSLCIIQAENPDGDSLGSALGLEEIITTFKNRTSETPPSTTELQETKTQETKPQKTEPQSTKSQNAEPQNTPQISNAPQISLYCPVIIPKYLHYFHGAERVTSDFDTAADGYIIVDTAATTLISKLLDDPVIKNRLYTAPVFVIDHHEAGDTLEFPHQTILETLPSCTNLIYKIAKDQNLPITAAAAQNLLGGLLSDTLGLSTESVTADTFQVAADLVNHGASPAALDKDRRAFMKKSQRILSYKADLIKHVEYSLEGFLATVHIPWEEISEYSDEYNPGVLIIEELRMVEGVQLAIAVKTYPDGKLTGKVRASLPIADQLAGYFGGGGHPYAAGFRTYDTTYAKTIQEIIKILPKLIKTLSNEDLADLTPAQRAALGLENSSEPTPAAGNGIKGLEKLL